jgi:PIN domain nuclease of toxin-antitoxin system
MILLLDTHVLIWAMMDPQKLSARAAKAMRSPDNELVLSCITLIELTIKVQSGKLQIPLSRDYMDRHLEEIGVSRILDVLPKHAYTMAGIPPVHGDPFDRLLAAQCISEDMLLVSDDRVFRKYPVEVLW